MTQLTQVLSGTSYLVSIKLANIFERSCISSSSIAEIQYRNNSELIEIFFEELVISRQPY